ncbi:MAG TPA: hypothetical protein VGP04_01240 [Pseudonocardiaceae bacterium]|nr:hypothetical protein [Pseudonocardiaceae bacterium]
MPYLISLLAVVLATVALLTVLARLRSTTRRLSEAARLTRAHFADRAGALTARVAALRVALNRRRRRGGGSSRPAPAA